MMRILVPPAACFPQRCGRALAALLLAGACGGAGAGAPPARPPLVVPATAATPQAAYFTDLLQLVLDKTADTDGEQGIAAHPARVSLARSVEMLRLGRELDVIWTVSDAERERTLLPVRISLLKELNNYRVFLIRAGDQARFDQIASLRELRKLTAGAGRHWADAAILRHNGFAVETSVRYDTLFPMLAAGRFDFFPRGLYEAWNEAAAHRALGLCVERRFMLYYPAPFYFFVNRDRSALARRLERGLRLAMADGSFDRLLNSYPAFRQGHAELAHTQRTVFHLALPPEP